MYHKFAANAARVSAVLFASFTLIATANAAPYAISYTSTITNNSFPDMTEGEPFTVTLVVDNGGSSALNQEWDAADLSCVKFTMNTAADVTFAQNLIATSWNLDVSDSLTTDGSGALLTNFSEIADDWGSANYAVTGFTPLGYVNWYLNGDNGIFYDADSGFDDPSGGVQMDTTSWTAPQPFVGTCPAAPTVSKAQAGCLTTYNSALAKIASTSAKELNKCVKSFAKDPVANPDPDGCTGSGFTLNSKIEAAVGKGEAKVAGKCAGAATPSFGPINATTIVNTLFTGQFASQSLGYALITGNVNGDTDLAEDAVKCTDAPAGAGCKCQDVLLSKSGKLLNTYLKLFNSCTKAGLGANTINSDATLGACMVDPLKLDPAGKLSKAITGLGDAIGKSCGAPVTDPLPNGFCGGMTGTALQDCIAQNTRCAACITVVFGNELPEPGSYPACDLFDDGMSNDSCDIVF